MRKILICILVLILVLALCGTSFASGNRAGKMYPWGGLVVIASATNLSHDEVTTAMSSGGSLYDRYDKSVALVSPSVYCTVDRVRLYPVGGSADLRIDPNYSSNWVGPSQTNGSNQVRAVQTILFCKNFLHSSDDIDGICGSTTIAAIEDFQAYHNLDDDGIVGPTTWRALCSSDSFQYETSIW